MPHAPRTIMLCCCALLALAGSGAVWPQSEPGVPVARSPLPADAVLLRGLVEQPARAPEAQPALRWLRHRDTGVTWPRLHAAAAPRARARVNADLQRLQLESIREALNCAGDPSEPAQFREGIEITLLDARNLSLRRRGRAECDGVTLPLEAAGHTWDLRTGASVDLYAMHGLVRPAGAGARQFSNAGFAHLFKTAWLRGKTAADQAFFHNCYDTPATPGFDYVLALVPAGLWIQTLFHTGPTRGCSTELVMPEEILRELRSQAARP